MRSQMRHVELPRPWPARHPRPPGMLDERAGRGRFTDSDFETRAVRLVRATGLPEPALQHTRA